jgi:hypothetical protein
MFSFFQCGGGLEIVGNGKYANFEDLKELHFAYGS